MVVKTQENPGFYGFGYTAVLSTRKFMANDAQLLQAV